MDSKVAMQAFVGDFDAVFDAMGFPDVGGDPDFRLASAHVHVADAMRSLAVASERLKGGPLEQVSKDAELYVAALLAALPPVQT